MMTKTWFYFFLNTTKPEKNKFRRKLKVMWLLRERARIKINMTEVHATPMADEKIAPTAHCL